MSLSTKQAEFVADMAEYDNWTDKFNRIMEYGEALPTYPEAYSISRFIVSVEGCTSINYLAIGHNSVNVYLFGKSNAAIPKGLIGVLYYIYNGQSMADIDAFNPTFVETTGLDGALSPQRLALLREMIRRVHAYSLGEVIVAPPTPQSDANAAEITALKTRVTTLEANYIALEARVAALEGEDSNE